MQTTNSHNSALKIFVSYHKQPSVIPPLDDEILLPIHVGKSLSDKQLHIQTDNQANGQQCDNISSKNESYCDLTAIYWAWKNLRKIYPDVKYVGLFHYRRFFAFSESNIFDEEISKPEHDIENYRVNLPDAMKIFESCDVILGRKILSPYPLDIHFSSDHVSEDYRTLREAVKNKFPDYFPAFIKLWEFSNCYSARNMFIMKYDDFADYCARLFALLSEIEDKIPFKHYGTYQKRSLGFMAERLLNVYVLKHGMKAKYLNIFHYSEKAKSLRLKDIIRLIIRRLKYNLIFRLFMTGNNRSSSS